MGETDTFPIISQKGNGNFRFPSIFHRNLSNSLKFPPKNYGEMLIFFAVISKKSYSVGQILDWRVRDKYHAKQDANMMKYHFLQYFRSHSVDERSKASD